MLVSQFLLSASFRYRKEKVLQWITDILPNLKTQLLLHRCTGIVRATNNRGQKCMHLHSLFVKSWLAASPSRRFGRCGFDALVSSLSSLYGLGPTFENTQFFTAVVCPELSVRTSRLQGLIQFAFDVASFDLGRCLRAWVEIARASVFFGSFIFCAFTLSFVSGPVLTASLQPFPSPHPRRRVWRALPASRPAIVAVKCGPDFEFPVRTHCSFLPRVWVLQRIRLTAITIFSGCGPARMSSHRIIITRVTSSFPVSIFGSFYVLGSRSFFVPLRRFSCTASVALRELRSRWYVRPPYLVNVARSGSRISDPHRNRLVVQSMSFVVCCQRSIKFLFICQFVSLLPHCGSLYWSPDILGPGAIRDIKKVLWGGTLKAPSLFHEHSHSFRRPTLCYLGVFWHRLRWPGCL